MWQWFCKERWRTDQHVWAAPAVIRIMSALVLLFSRNIPGEFSLCAVHLKRPSSRHLWKTFAFLELLFLFDFIRQEITKCFVTCWKTVQKAFNQKTCLDNPHSPYINVCLEISLYMRRVTYSRMLKCKYKHCTQKMLQFPINTGTPRISSLYINRSIWFHHLIQVINWGHFSRWVLTLASYSHRMHLVERLY